MQCRISASLQWLVVMVGDDELGGARLLRAVGRNTHRRNCRCWLADYAQPYEAAAEKNLGAEAGHSRSALHDQIGIGLGRRDVRRWM